MQNIKAAVAVFCAACICAELVSHLTGSGWARRGIKTIAGLYILAVVLSKLPGLRTESPAVSIPEPSAVSFETWETTVLAQTKDTLEQQLETSCQKELGLSISFEVNLYETNGSVAVSSVVGTPVEALAPEEQSAVADMVQKTLGVVPEWKPPGREKNA